MRIWTVDCDPGQPACSLHLFLRWGGPLFTLQTCVAYVEQSEWRVVQPFTVQGRAKFTGGRPRCCLRNLAVGQSQAVSAMSEPWCYVVWDLCEVARRAR